MTAELAIALPALVMVLASFLWVIALAAGQASVAQAAREGARAAARGESAAAVRARVQDVAPGATVSITRGGDLVRVSATRRAPQPFPRLRRMRWAMSASASALAEHP